MTVALNEYTGDIEKTAKICRELDYFGIKLKNPKFRYSRGEYSFDKETNSIYKGMASIKFLNENASEELYELRDKHYNSFTELVRVIQMETSLNFRQLKILVQLNFFSEFGKNKKLLEVVDKYESRLKNKSLKEKTVEIRMQEIMDFESKLEDKSLDIKSQVQAEMEFVGTAMTTKDTLPENVYMVTEMKNQYLKLYQIKTGETFDYRVKKTDMNKEPFGLFNVLRVNGIKKQNKKKIEDGQWKTLENEFNVYISTWDIIL
jgi:DNA polymerase III alpha subunit